MQQEIPAGLYGRIIKEIDRQEEIRLKNKMILDIFGLVLSLTALVPLTIKFLADMASSGLSQFLSLALTDFQIVMANVGNYTLSLLEATPVMSLGLLTAALLALLFYAAKLADAYANFKIIIKQKI